MLVCFDTETTGVDLRHSCRPFYWSIAYDNATKIKPATQDAWRWDVDPKTRQVHVVEEELDEICHILDTVTTICGHNIGFDVRALWSVRPSYRWPWHKTHCTQVSAHLLGSNSSLNLTDQVVIHLGKLGVNIDRHEKSLGEIVKKCRQKVRTKAWKARHGEWRLAKDDYDDLPSARSGGGEKDKLWKNDLWLPHAVALTEKYPEDHPYLTCLPRYANADTDSGLLLYKVHQTKIKQRGLERVYEHCRQMVPIIWGIEQYGVTTSLDNQERLKHDYERVSTSCGNTCVHLAESYDHVLTLPKGGSRNKSLDSFLFDVLELPTVSTTDTGKPAFDKSAIDLYLTLFGKGTPEYLFIQRFAEKRKRDTALTYLSTYRRFQQGIAGHRGYARLYPNLRQTGTRTTRLSSQNPNEQNISKRGYDVLCDRCGGDGCSKCKETGYLSISLRYVFGPLPGREWWSIDYENLELRIPAYYAGETEMIALFEQPDKPPYFGSNHLLNFSTVYPDIWSRELTSQCSDKEHIKNCFKGQPHNWYQYCKNGGFALQYQAGDATADAAFHKPGAAALLRARFQRLAKLNQQQMEHARRFGHIQTIPNRRVDPEHGYPLVSTRTKYGVKTTVPLSHFVQGTAGDIMREGMFQCHRQLQEWNDEGFDGHIVMNVHDELVFDFPAGISHPSEEYQHWKKYPNEPRKSRKSNWWRISRMGELMRQAGDQFGIPTPVSISYHPDNWGEEKRL